MQTTNPTSVHQSTSSPSQSTRSDSPSEEMSEVGNSPSTLRPTVLGWLSIALGTTALAAPLVAARLIGAPLSKTTDLVLRGVGIREIGVGAGLLTRKQSSAGLTWLRVLGDAMDLSLLVGAMGARRAKQQRLLRTVGVIAGVALIDLVAAVMQTREERASYL